MEENKYLKLDFFQGILLFVISYLWSFLEHAKQIFLYLLHTNDDHENLTIVHPPLKVVHAYPHYITDFDKNFHLSHVMTITKLMNLMKPRLIYHLMHLIQHPPRLNIDTDP
jgi:hypothetical protein